MWAFIALLIVVGVVYYTYKSIDESIDKDMDPNHSTHTVAPVLTQAAPCGCGRSASGFCVGLHKLSDEEWANHPDNPNKLTKKRKTKKSEQ